MYVTVFVHSENQGSGQQCCYDKNGILVIRPPGGGTVDLYAPNTWGGRLKHLIYDVVPFLYCCKGELKEHYCDKYYERRPSDDGSRFNCRPPG